MSRKRRINMEYDKETSVSPPSGPRMPRWTRREILALVRAKRDVEGGGGSHASGRVRRSSNSPDGGHVSQPKWNAVSDGCQLRGVQRGPSQCRKRWTNLIAAFRKIRHWEKGLVKEEEKSNGDVASPAHVEQEQQKGYWEMGGDERKEKGLPSRFDQVVYDIMQGHDVADVPDRVYEENDEVVMDSEEEEEPEEARMAPPTQWPPGPPISVIPISTRRFQPFHEESSDAECGSGKQKDGTPEQTSLDKEGNNRKRSREFDPDDVRPEDDKLKRLTDTLVRGTRLVAAQLEAQTIQLQNDRIQRKEQFDNLFKVLNRLADSVMKIAEKL